MQRHTPSRILAGFFARAQWDRALGTDMEEDDGGEEDEGGRRRRRRRRMGKEQEQESEDEEQEVARVEGSSCHT